MGDPLVVAVIGSGVSGLAAARTLVDNYPGDGLSVLVLEAGEHIGGRTFTDRSIGWPSISGAEVDVGASWMHGSSSNHPITRIKDALGLGTFVTDDDKMEIRCDGEEVDEDRFDDYEELVEAAQKIAKKSSSDMSMWDAMAELDEGGGRDHPLMQMHMANSMEFDVGASPKQISAKLFENDEAFSGKETILLGGYSQIPEALAGGRVRLEPGSDNRSPTVTAADGVPLDVRLGVCVQAITLSQGHLIVSTQCGQQIRADHAVLAVPLGVLKAGRIEFSPELPSGVATAISRIGFGDVVKVGILFDEVFWDKGTHYYGLAHKSPGLHQAERFSYFLNCEGAVHKPVLMTFAFGESAMEVETLSDEEVWANIQANLAQVFGERALHAEMVGMWRSRWGHDPNFGGAYSFPAVHSRPEDWKAFLSPCMDQRLHLAGEHTCYKYRGTVHGAFFSGQRAAREILQAHGGHQPTPGGRRPKKDDRTPEDPRKRKDNRRRKEESSSSSSSS